MGCSDSSEAVHNHSSDDFRTLVTSQIPTQKVHLKKYPLEYTHVLQLNTMNLMKVKQLSLESCRLNNQSLEGLLEAKLPSLRKLNLNHNQIGPLGCRTLSSSFLVANLTSLELNHNKIKDVGVKALATCDLSLIEDLSLNDNQISTEGIRSLADKLDSIECLSLGGNQLNDQSLVALKSMKPYQVYFLKLSRNNLSDDGLRKLLTIFKNLDVLLVDRNSINSKKGAFDAKGVFLFM